jgi:hypothetical protein
VRIRAGDGHPRRYGKNCVMLRVGNGWVTGEISKRANVYAGGNGVTGPAWYTEVSELMNQWISELGGTAEFRLRSEAASGFACQLRRDKTPRQDAGTRRRDKTARRDVAARPVRNTDYSEPPPRDKPARQAGGTRRRDKPECGIGSLRRKRADKLWRALDGLCRECHSGCVLAGPASDLRYLVAFCKRSPSFPAASSCLICGKIHLPCSRSSDSSPVPGGGCSDMCSLTISELTMHVVYTLVGIYF